LNSARNLPHLAVLVSRPILGRHSLVGLSGTKSSALKKPAASVPSSGHAVLGHDGFHPEK
jgi:hypothetical protein